MPYDPSDPRSKLSTAATAARPTTRAVPRPAHYRELGLDDPDEVLPGGSRTWWTRSEAMVIAHTAANGGDELTTESGGEFVVLVLDGATAWIEHESGMTYVGEDAVVVVPAGTSTVRVIASGTVIRVVAADTAPDLALRCRNTVDYLDPDHNVAPFAAWPEPVDGPRIRAYPVSQFPIEQGRLGRIFRCSTVMVNVLPEDDRPRDPSLLSPHHHDDFEQVSLQVHGDYVHHMRVDWTPDSTTWRDDEHRLCHAPAVVVIPPPLVHTSQSVGAMRHWLIDVFAPPRRDFSERPGWVLNADEYPMPT